MKRQLLLILSLTLLFSCASQREQDYDVSGPIVHNWPDTTGLEKVPGSLAYITKDSSLKVSRLGTWSTVPDKATVDAALATKFPITGGNMTGNLGVQSGAANKVLIAMNLGGSSSAGNSTFGPSAYYLGLGHREWGVNTYRLIGFGFRYTTNDHYPVVMGYQETSGTSSTYGDFNIWTRPVTTNTAAILRFKVAAAGNVKSYGPITANEDVATKAYVDTSYVIVKTITPGSAYVMPNTLSKSFIGNNASAASVWTLPPAKQGLTFTIWKIGSSVMTIQGGTIADAGKSGTKIVSDNQAGTSITVVCTGSTWVITSKNGSWTTQ